MAALRRPGPASGQQLRFIALDTTNNCNLRCPFCFNDFSRVGPRTFMTREVFRKALRLLPLSSGDLFFSCLFEPTLHPEFIDLLEMIPAELQPRVFFTTNLAADLDEEVFRRLSRLRLGFVNVSVDSLDPAVYPRLRRGGDLGRHLANLERLTAAFAAAPAPPELRVITMALRPNRPEIRRLVERCSRDFAVARHEIRYIYANPYLSLEWKRDNLLTPGEWQELQKDCAGLPCVLFPPPPGYYTEDRAPYSQPGGSPGGPPAPPLALRIDAAGRAELEPLGEVNDLQGLDDPYGVISRRLATLAQRAG
jgi:MoaA/NifB/PqqE/SkfB family radical SAM enzyme